MVTARRHVFFDTSALVKFYLFEPGSNWVQATIADPHTTVLVSTITFAELIAAFAKGVRDSRIRPDEMRLFIGLAQRDFAHQRFQRRRVTWDTTQTAGALAATYYAPRTTFGLDAKGLRGYDAVQLASALTLSQIYQPLTFATADASLATIAIHTQRLIVINPQSNP